MKELMSLEPGMKYLNDNENYMFYDFENSDGIPRRMFYWGEGSLLFSLTIPISHCDKITSVDMLSVSMTNEIDIVDSIFETDEINIVSSSSETNSESDSSLEPVAAPPVP